MKRLRIHSACYRFCPWVFSAEEVFARVAAIWILVLLECRFLSDKAYPSELDNELPLKVNTDLLNFWVAFVVKVGAAKCSSSFGPQAEAAPIQMLWSKPKAWLHIGEDQIQLLINTQPTKMEISRSCEESAQGYWMPPFNHYFWVSNIILRPGFLPHLHLLFTLGADCRSWRVSGHL